MHCASRESRIYYAQLMIPSPTKSVPQFDALSGHPPWREEELGDGDIMNTSIHFQVKSDAALESDGANTSELLDLLVFKLLAYSSRHPG